MEQKLDMEHRVTAVEERSKSNTRRIEEMEKRQDDLEMLASSVSALAIREERMESDVKEIKADVKLLTGKPAKKWESMEEKVLLAFVAAVVGFILAQVGL